MRALVAAAFLLALAPSIACAQLPDPPAAPSDADVAQARNRFVRGMELAQAERWDAALDEFTRSYELSGSPVALFNMASTLRSLGRFLDARAAFDRLLADPGLDSETRRAAEDLRVEVSSQVASVRVDGVPDGLATVVADGDEREPTRARPIAVELDPGARALTIRLPSYTPWSWEGTLAPGAQVRVDASLTPEPTGGVDALPWVLAGVGAAVVGVVLGLVIADLEAQLDPRTSLVITLP